MLSVTAYFPDTQIQLSRVRTNAGSKDRIAFVFGAFCVTNNPSRAVNWIRSLPRTCP